MLRIEFYSTLAVLALALIAPRFGHRWFEATERVSDRFAGRGWLSVAAIAAIFLTLRLPLLLLQGIPTPCIPDEFSYVLAGETYSLGRLTNPTHPMWVHFETLHVDQKPTYMSMYPPGTGLAMAAGIKLFGHPWYGVLISLGAMCAALTWMLQGWVTPGWAFVGGLIAAVRFSLFTYWSDGYWGSPLAVAAGAILLGVYPRLRQSPRLAHGWSIGFAAFVLAITRPYEGAILCATLLGPFLYALILHRRLGLRILARKILAPVAIITVIGGAWIGYYNHRVFGSAWTPPYANNRATYSISPFFIWDKERPEPTYNHRAIRDLYVNWELKAHRQITQYPGLLIMTIVRAVKWWSFYLSALFTVVLLLASIKLIFMSSSWLFALILATNTAGILVSGFTVFPHYWSASAGATLALMVSGLRSLSSSTLFGRTWGRSFAGWATMLVLLLGFVRALRPELRMDTGIQSWYYTFHYFEGREEVIQKLQAEKGMHLVIVRYTAGHDSSVAEWVYNEPDIDRARIVWAHEMGHTKDIELLHYFRNRMVWLLEPDTKPVRLRRYHEVVPQTR